MIYMTPGEASIRLQERHGIATELFIGDVLAASEELRGMAPFTVDLETGPLPDALLDWVALRSNEIRQTVRAHDVPPASRIAFGDVALSLELGRGDRELHHLVEPYLRRKGRVS